MIPPELFDDEARSYDAVLVVSFGGPEGPDDVMPFLDNVLRGLPISPAGKARIAERYYRFGGVSPIAEYTREFVRALEEALAERGPRLPVYLGNRNWHPMLPDTMARMARDGVRSALVHVTSTFSSYSGCRRYREDLFAASNGLPEAPRLDRMRYGYNHPGFVAAMADRLRAAFARFPAADPAPALVFTAHSLPLSMARGCDYEAELRESCGLVAGAAGASDWSLAYQSQNASYGRTVARARRGRGAAGGARGRSFRSGGGSHRVRLRPPGGRSGSRRGGRGNGPRSRDPDGAGGHRGCPPGLRGDGAGAGGRANGRESRAPRAGRSRAAPGHLSGGLLPLGAARRPPARALRRRFGVSRARRPDAVVIGAGLSGLTAALRLEEAGLDVQVVEARRRVGGRIRSVPTAAGTLESGGATIGGGYRRVLAAAERHGVGLVDATPLLRFFREQELVLDGDLIRRAEWPDHPANPFPKRDRDLMPWNFGRVLTVRENPLDTPEDWLDPSYARRDVPAP